MKDLELKYILECVLFAYLPIVQLLYCAIYNVCNDLCRHVGVLDHKRMLEILSII